MSNHTIDLIMITGFLGTGKTSMINHFLNLDLPGTTGLLINDFGSIVVDSSVIKKESNEDLQIWEVANGSIFCSCKTANFVMGLELFARKKPTRIIVEASGMSDPSGMQKILDDNRLADLFKIKTIICLTDPFQTPKLWNTLPALQKQTASANLILINKTDLVSEKELEELESMIREVNPHTPFRRTTFGEITLDDLKGLEDSFPRGNIVSCNTPASRPGSFTLNPEEASLLKITSFLKDNMQGIWRVKGWIKDRESKTWYYLSNNGTQMQTEKKTPPEGTPQGLILIIPPGTEKKLSRKWDLHDEVYNG